MARKPKNEVVKEQGKPTTQEVYAFPTRSRCPRCGSMDTEATSTQGDIEEGQLPALQPSMMCGIGYAISISQSHFVQMGEPASASSS